MKYQIEVTEEQLHIIINSVEKVCRFNMGQLVDITEDINWLTDNTSGKRNLVDSTLEQLKVLLFPKLRRNESYGIGVKENDKLSEHRQKQYEVYRELRHQFNKINEHVDIYSTSTLKHTSDEFPLVNLTQIP